MSTLIAAFIFIAIVITIMAIGVIFGRAPIKGTCGGLNQMMGDKECELCGGNRQSCENQSAPSNPTRQPQMFNPKDS